MLYKLLSDYVGIYTQIQFKIKIIDIYTELLTSLICIYTLILKILIVNIRIPNTCKLLTCGYSLILESKHMNITTIYKGIETKELK